MSIVDKEVNEHPRNIKDSLKAFIVWVMPAITYGAVNQSLQSILTLYRGSYWC